MMVRDREATRAQHYEDKRSYVCFDKREVLYGKDWDARKYVVWCNAGGRCEQMIYSVDKPRTWIRCCNPIAHVHHKVKRSEKRDDRLENLEGLCALHHRLKHPEHQTQFSRGRQSAEL